MYTTDGTHIDSESYPDRYKKGFEDIFEREASNLNGNKVAFLFSHSDGVDSFLKVAGYQDKL